MREGADEAARGTRDDAERLSREVSAQVEEALRESAEQTAWTRATMAELLKTAELEAQRIRATAHAAAAKLLRNRRRRLQDVVSRLTERLRQEVLEADDQAVTLGEAGRQVLAAAQKEAESIVSAAEDDAEGVRTEVEAGAALVEERAQRRVQEAESGARQLRERVAEEVTRRQRAAQDHEREARQQAVDIVRQAREEADTIRSRARTQLEQARLETAELTRRRDEIATELEQLSGVIQALAVPEDASQPESGTHSGVPADRPSPPAVQSSEEDR